MKIKKLLRIKPGERSFTLIETVIALGVMVAVIFEISNVQGNAIYFSEYERNVTKASWLGKGIMSKIEYEWATRDFSEFEFKESEKPFEGEENKEFTYTVEIAEWKLPLMSLIGGGGDGKSDTDGDGVEEVQTSDGQTDAIRSQIEGIFGDDILKIARVEVFWPEGAQRNSIALSLLLTNQKKLDEQIGLLPVAETNDPPPPPPPPKLPPPPPKK